MLAALPLFTGAVFAPLFFPHNLTTPVSTLFAAVIAVLFYAALGIKDLILIHRETLLEAGAYVLSYIAFLLFFMQEMPVMFLPAWLFTVFCIWLAFLMLAEDYRLALVFATLMGELIWIVAWLPIGFLNAASACFAVMLFSGDAVRENRISLKNTCIVIGIIAFIGSTSYWEM